MIENKSIYVSVEKLQTLLSENHHIQLLDNKITQILVKDICKHTKKSIIHPDSHTICIKKVE